MAQDVQLDKLEYLQQYGSFLSNVHDSSLINFKEFESTIDSECDDLHSLERRLEEKRDEAGKVLNKAKELQEQMKYPDAQSDQRLCALMECIEDVYQKIIREIELCEENIQNINTLLSNLQENKDDFKEKLSVLIDRDIDVVKKSIDAIERYKSVR